MNLSVRALPICLGGCFSSYVACGSLNRSMPNLESGARTPMASVFAALLVIPLVAMSSSLLALIPFAAISGLLLLVAWSLMDFDRWRALYRANPGEFMVAALTLLATISLRMEVAILIGSALSLGLFLHRTSRPAMRSLGFDRDGVDRPFVVLDGSPDQSPECPQIKLLRMEGSVYFGATAHVSDQLQGLREAIPMQKHLLVMAKSMNFVDASGAQMWRSELLQRRAMGGDLYFHRPRLSAIEQWERDGFLELLGPENLFPDKRTAIHKIYQRLDPEICRSCKARIFVECATPRGHLNRSTLTSQPSCAWASGTCPVSFAAMNQKARPAMMAISSDTVTVSRKVSNQVQKSSR